MRAAGGAPTKRINVRAHNVARRINGAEGDVEEAIRQYQRVTREFGGNTRWPRRRNTGSTWTMNLCQSGDGFCRYSTSLVSKRYQRIDFRRTACGDITGNQRHHRKQSGDRCERRRIGWLDGKE